MSAVIASPRFSVEQHVGISLLIATVLTAFSYFVGIQMNWITELNWIEVAAVFTSYSCTYLFVMQTRIAYIIAVASTALWAYFFWDANLLGSMAQNLYLIPTVIYGWFIWGRDEETKPIHNVKFSHLPIYFLITAAVYGIIAWTIGQLGGELAKYDALILVGSVPAQFLLDRKKIETWMVWIAVDVLAVWFYAKQGYALTSFQFVFFTFNAMWGYYEWRKSMLASKNEKVINDFMEDLMAPDRPETLIPNVSTIEAMKETEEIIAERAKRNARNQVRHTPRTHKRDDDIVTPVIIATSVDSYSDAPSSYNPPTETYSGHGGSFGGGGSSASYDSSSSSSSSSSSDSSSSSSDSSSF